ncbi:sugar transferase [Methylobacterium sp. M6A4_1b]
MKTLSFPLFGFRGQSRRDQVASVAVESDLEGRFSTPLPMEALTITAPRDPAFLSKLLTQPVPSSGSGQARSRIAPLGGLRKRYVDFAIAVGVLILVLPLLLMIALAIKVSMGGPVIYRHRRIGCYGREFDCLKFRTMVTNADAVLEALLRTDPAAAAEWRRTQKLVRDPRITWIGRTLRRTSLDELPQIFNVLRGDMSCVGPRPIVRAELIRYGAHSDLFQSVRPGMTGLWQVSGRSSLDYEDRVMLDCQYVKDWSVWSDLNILIRTIPAVLNTRQTC